MPDAIIGGAIAAVLGAAGGAITGLLLERRHEKARKLAIIEALLTEIQWNLTMCKNPTTLEMWWFAPYKLEAYHAYKGQLLFLSEEVRSRLARAVLTLEGVNTAIQMHLSQVGSGQKVVEKPLKIPKELIKDLESANEELQKWRNEHTRSLFNR